MKPKFSRRDFLKVASIGTASALALSCGVLTPDEEDEIMADPLSTSADVLVLGAGIAGLAAARSLLKRGIA
jgi:NADPH-dependent 2,4-dienoyl-CoA reductase/sulfur reductase-like enzyme